MRPLQPSATPPDIEDFQHWDLGPDVQGAIAAMGITSPTPIQRLAIGPVLAGKDVIAKAETGTGKTLAFGAPMAAKIDAGRASVLGLVLCPTRELAQQVGKVLAALGEPRGIKVALIVGGEPAEPQVRALQSGAQIVVGTPGRILDLFKQRFLSFPWTEFVVLDEADVMFEIGFIDDVRQILSLTPDERQTLLFSATFPPELLKLARECTRDPAEVATAAGLKTVDSIEQSWIHVADEDRPMALVRLIEISSDDDVFLVFCPRRTEVDRLMRRLERLPYAIKALHGGYDQAARFRVMSAFRTGEVKTLVATDVASRGLDVAHVTTVVNYGSPQDITDYTHRIGRTGRAGRSGRAVTLVGSIDMRKWKQIQREATWDIHEVELPPRGRRDGGRPARDAGRAEQARPAARPDRAREEPQPEPARPLERGRDRHERGGARPERGAARRGRGAGEAERRAADHHPSAEQGQRSAEQGQRSAEQGQRGAEQGQRGAGQGQRGAGQAERGAGQLERAREPERGARHGERGGDPRALPAAAAQEPRPWPRDRSSPGARRGPAPHPEDPLQRPLPRSSEGRGARGGERTARAQQPARSEQTSRTSQPEQPARPAWPRECGERKRHGEAIGEAGVRVPERPAPTRPPRVLPAAGGPVREPEASGEGAERRRRRRR